MSASTSLRAVFMAGPALPLISFLARLPAAICPIGTLLMLTELNGIGRAGIVAGLLWAGQAVGGPFLGRFADRHGHRPVILGASLANAAAIAALVGAVLADLPVPAEAALAAVVGLTVPQVGPLSRTRWIAIVEARGTQDQPAAARERNRELTGRVLSFDTTIDEIGFMAGPALAGLAVLLIHPVAAMVLAGALIAVFGALFAVHPTAPRGTGAKAASGVRVLTPALGVLFAMALLQGTIWGSANAGVSALAEHLGDAGMAGFIWGAMAVTSSLAGLATTMRTAKRDLTVRLRLAIVGQLILLVPLLAVDSFLGAAAAVAGIGLAVAPHLIAVFGLAERVAPSERMGEAMALLGSGLIAGQGIAALAAGQLAQHSGYPAAFILTCASGTAAALTALTLVRPTTFASAPAASATAVEVTGPATDSRTGSSSGQAGRRRAAG
ncbi:MFS transporter [Streptomyces sp. NPDC050485]|uniref:MFS transporter n=1 Tax=Streptomyces sp. NPDC050485 TaxID=3365617 RepID=UPI0037B36F51